MLTVKQQRFTEEYVVDYNATAAAKRAGYSPKTAGAIGFENLTKPEIQKALGIVQDKAAEQTALTHQYVLEGLMGIATDHEATQSSRVRAYELLGKHQGMFTDRLEITDMPSRELVAGWITAIEQDLADTDDAV